MRLYRLLLRLYPASFRNEYGEEMARVFAARRRDAHGAVAAAAPWIGAILDVVRNAPPVHWDILRQDLRYTRRSLARARGFAATAVIVTALGIGANTAVFSITDHVLLRPLSFPDEHRLVKLWQNVPGYARMEASPANYRDWHRMSTSFDGMGAFFLQAKNLVGAGEPRRIQGAAVTPEVLPLLGVRPLLGRTFVENEAREGAHGIVILSYALWQSQFGGDPDVVGRTVRLDDEPCQVIGVMPRGFPFPTPATQFWMPTRFGPQHFEDRSDNYLDVVARLRPNMSLASARDEMRSVAARLEREFPASNERTTIAVVALRDVVSDQARLLLVALFGASLCILLIACANLASLLLARALNRQRELSVRAALGAGRERLVRQLMTESVVLASAGGIAGVALAYAAVPLLAQLAPAALPVSDVATIDARVLVFAAALTVATALGFGAVPALRLCRGVDASGLREGARASVSRRTARMRSGLVIAEISASVILVVISGLLIRSLMQVRQVDPGFRADDTVAIETPIPQPKYAGTARRAALYMSVLSQVSALPGVTAAGYISWVPMDMRGGIWPVSIAGRTTTQRTDGHTANLRFVTPGIFDALGIRLLRGREVSDADVEGAPMVAVVSESLSRRYWPDGDALGRQVNMAFRDRTVVGIVADVRVRGLERDGEPQIYLPYQQVPDNFLVFYSPKELVVRSSMTAAAVVPAVRDIVRAADPDLPIARVRTLRDLVEADTGARAVQLRILLVFAGLALILAGVGVHGLLAFAVSQRQTEIGVRMALGATRRDILRMVLGQGASLAALGAGAGLAGGYAAAHGIRSLLAGVSPDDASTLAAAAAVAILMALSGSAVPALRAARTDPTRVMRTD